MRPRPCTPVLIVFAAALAGVWLAVHARAADPVAADPAKGKKLYATRCVACHKPDGSGGVKVTGNPTPDFRNAAFMATRSDSLLRDCIANGRPKSGMVAWSKQGLKPADIEHLIAHVRTFSAPKDGGKK
jgi:cytochrome c oxidase cbb3-type subunit 3